ncbi:hypothetical protein [Amycolatopsis eburnea]|uniref:Uncharacterized protein n=1 Tax=Amycolatopsis eburnea TaxID=2267691 RepID=A0A427T0J8_9PSEU|nr:hypothetical protein [Amycolatopsis eburnea]RSD10696.1 hypothetical protein EIY87_38390 [Amycolatopsis eburnea]
MNRSIRATTVLAVAAAVVVACGRAPEPPSAALPETTASAEETAESPTVETSEPQPTHSHPAATTRPAPKPRPNPPTTPKPQPKPPDRWVLSSADRRSIEQRTHISFLSINAADSLRTYCPKHDACIKIAFDVDPGLGHEDEDCWIDHVVIPDPLHEGGTITWVVNNLCDSAE